MWVTVHRAGAAIMLFLIAAQAVVAGQHLFGDWGIGLHAALGNTVFTLAVLLTAVAMWKLDSVPLQIVGIALVIMISAQIGLGYSSRDSESAAALHIPLGVVTFGAVLYQLLMAWPRLVVRVGPSPEPASDLN